MKKSLFLIAALAAAGTTFGSILANEKYVTNTVNTVVYNASTQIIEQVVSDPSITNEAAVAVAKAYTDVKVADAITTASEDATEKARLAKEGAISTAKSYTDDATNAVASAGAADLNAVKVELNGNIATAKSEAISTAAADASTKTNAVLATANAYALEQAGVAKETAQTYADTQDAALSGTLNATIVSATNATVNAAVAAAAEDATQKADAAKQGAISEANTTAQGYANTAKTEAINEAATDATAKAEAAKQSAAADATTKATFANTNAIAVAKAYADEKSSAAESNAKTYADGLKSSLDATITGNKTDIENKLNTATNGLTASIEGVKTRVTTAEGRLDGHDTKIATLEGKIAGVYHFKGTVATATALPATAENADVYYVSDVKESYAYLIPTGEATGTWKPIGKDFDLSAYKVWTDTKAYIDDADGGLESTIEGVANNLTALSGTVTANKNELNTKITVVSNKVAALETKVAEDKTELQGLISAADTKAQTGVDNAAAALARANEVEADLTVVINSNKVDLTTAIANAKQEAKSYADTQDTAVKDELNPLITAAKNQADKGVADAAAAKTFAVAASNNVMVAAKGFADAAESAAKSEAATNLANVKSELEGKIDLKDNITSVDAKIVSVSNNVIAIAATTAQSKANTAESNAKSYTDTGVAGAKTYADEQDVKATNDVLRLAKEYTDSKDPGSKSYVQEQIAAVSNNVVKIAAADATFKVNDAKVYLIDQDGQVMRYAREQDTVVSNAAVAAVASAKTELTTSINAVDARVTGVQTYAEGASNNVLTAAKEFTTMTKSALEESIQTAKNEAIAIAATDASTKTNAVLAQAKTYSDAQLTAKVGAITQTTVMGEITAQANAAMTYSDNRLSNAKTELLANDTVVSNAAIAAVSTAKSELNTSIGNVDQRVTTLSTHVDTTSNLVLTAAKSYSDGNLTAAKSYTDTEINSAKEYADGKAYDAKQGAISAAASDATTKATAAENNAVATVNATIGTLTETTVVAEIAAAKEAAITTAGSNADTKIANKVGTLTKNTVVEEIAAAKVAATNDAAVTAQGYATTAESNAKSYAKAQDTVVSNAFVAADTKVKSDLTTTITTKETALKTQITTGDNTTYINSSNLTEKLIKEQVTDKWVPSPADPTSTEEETYELTVTPHTITTLLPSSNLTEGTEMYVTCKGTNDRNFTMFFPKEPALLAGMPITVETEFPTGLTAAYATRKTIYKLPAKIVCEQPYEKLAVFTVTELDDGSDWTPVVTNVCLKCTDITNPTFNTTGSHALEGTSLHCAKTFKVVYPTQLSPLVTVTNDLETAGTDGLISGTFYYYTSAVNNKAATGLAVDGTTQKSWFEIIYTTVNGTATISRQEIDFSAE